ncbi:hypothetical protein EGW08_005453, partial [Elysia chlorotica]
RSYLRCLPQQCQGHISVVSPSNVKVISPWSPPAMPRSYLRCLPQQCQGHISVVSPSNVKVISPWSPPAMLRSYLRGLPPSNVKVISPCSTPAMSRSYLRGLLHVYGGQGGRVLVEAQGGQAAHAWHRVHPLQAAVLAGHHGGGHLPAVVLVDDAVLRALHDLDVLQVLAVREGVGY